MRTLSRCPQQSQSCTSFLPEKHQTHSKISKLYLALESKLHPCDPLWPFTDPLVICRCALLGGSAGWRGDLIIFGAFEESRVAGAHLERSLTGDVRGTPSAWPGLWVEELARVVGAVAEARAVEAGMTGLVDLLCWVALHEQVDGHDACTLRGEVKRTWWAQEWFHVKERM